MSASSPDPSWQLPLPPDSGPEKRRVKPVHLLLGSLLALALLCCGGATAVEVFTSGKSDKSGAAPATTDPSDSAEPSDDPATSAVKGAVATSPTPTTTPRKSAKPKPTTPKPTTKPTTRPPTKSPTPTPTPTLPIVRAGAFCSPVGAFGITARGKLARCTRDTEDERARWRVVQTEELDL